MSDPAVCRGVSSSRRDVMILIRLVRLRGATGPELIDNGVIPQVPTSCLNGQVAPTGELLDLVSKTYWRSKLS